MLIIIRLSSERGNNMIVRVRDTFTRFAQTSKPGLCLTIPADSLVQSKHHERDFLNIINIIMVHTMGFNDTVQIILTAPTPGWHIVSQTPARLAPGSLQ